jgi:hypothetical protein
MIKKKPLRISLIILGLVLLFASGLVACQSQGETQPTDVETGTAAGETITSQPEQPSPGDAQSDPAAPTSAPAEAEPDPAAIEAAWQSSPHADAFVLDAEGNNNTCARCHAPINWMPTMDDLPDSCFACKFELEDPPSYIPEGEWVSIPCNVCHPIDRDDNIQPEIAWLEIAPLGEYAEVTSPTELCLKCHAPIDIPGHGEVQLVNAHADYECTGCHTAHLITTSCVSEACHSDVIDPVTPIPGHDADHQAVSCVACHDGSGMEVGPDDGTGLWTTFTTTGSAESDLERFVFASHNIVLQSSCDRCHFVDNPWALSTDVVIP